MSHNIVLCSVFVVLKVLLTTKLGAHVHLITDYFYEFFELILL